VELTGRARNVDTRKLSMKGPANSRSGPMTCYSAVEAASNATLAALEVCVDCQFDSQIEPSLGYISQRCAIPPASSGAVLGVGGRCC
jgi:hypothetical protein